VNVLKDTLKGSAEALEKMLNSLLSADEFVLESVKINIGDQQTLTGEKNMILTVTAFIRPREESEVYETLQRSINAFLANMKRSGFQAEVEMPTLTLRITLKSITLPNL
jgi:flavodoxin